jgi:hypothetical protein
MDSRGQCRRLRLTSKSWVSSWMTRWRALHKLHVTVRVISPVRLSLFSLRTRDTEMPTATSPIQKWPSSAQKSGKVCRPLEERSASSFCAEQVSGTTFRPWSCGSKLLRNSDEFLHPPSVLNNFISFDISTTDIKLQATERTDWSGSSFHSRRFRIWTVS